MARVERRHQRDEAMWLAEIAELEAELSRKDECIVDGLMKRNELKRELAEARKDAERYQWAVENAMIETSSFKHDGRDPASTKLPLDNAIDAAMRQEEAKQHGESE